VAGLRCNILEHSAAENDAGKSGSSLLWLNRSESPTLTECLPTAVESENCKSMPVVLSAPRRQFACFLRTKSDGAVTSRGSSSCRLISAADVSSKPLTLVNKVLSGSRQIDSRTQSEEGICDVMPKRINFKRVQSNSVQWPTLTQDTVYGEVLAKNVRYEYSDSVKSSNAMPKMPKASKTDDHNKSRPGLQLLTKSSGSFQPVSMICRNGNRNLGFAGLSEGSVASTVMMQEVAAAGHSNVNTHEIKPTCCRAVPLSTSNIVNISRPCSAARQNSTGIHQRVVVIKRRHNFPST